MSGEVKTSDEHSNHTDEEVLELTELDIKEIEDENEHLSAHDNVETNNNHSDEDEDKVLRTELEEWKKKAVYAEESKQDEITALSLELHALDEENMQLSKALEESNNQVAELKQQLQNDNNSGAPPPPMEIDSLTQEVTTLKNEVENLSQQVTQLNREKEELTEKFTLESNKLTQDLNKLKSENLELGKKALEVEQLTQEINKLKAENSELGRASSSTQELDKLRSENLELEKKASEVEKLTQELNKLKTENLEASSLTEKLTQELNKLKSENLGLEQKASEVEKLTAELNKLKTENLELAKESTLVQQQLTQDIAQLKKEKADWTANSALTGNKEESETIRKLQEELKGRNKEKIELESELEELKDENRELTEELRELNEKKKKSREDSLVLQMANLYDERRQLSEKVRTATQLVEGGEEAVNTLLQASQLKNENEALTVEVAQLRRENAALKTQTPQTPGRQPPPANLQSTSLQPANLQEIAQLKKDIELLSLQVQEVEQLRAQNRELVQQMQDATKAQISTEQNSAEKDVLQLKMKNTNQVLFMKAKELEEVQRERDQLARVGRQGAAVALQAQLDNAKETILTKEASIAKLQERLVTAHKQHQELINQFHKTSEKLHANKEEVLASQRAESDTLKDQLYLSEKLLEETTKLINALQHQGELDDDLTMTLAQRDREIKELQQLVAKLQQNSGGGVVAGLSGESSVLNNKEVDNLKQQVAELEQQLNIAKGRSSSAPADLLDALSQRDKENARLRQQLREVQQQLADAQKKSTALSDPENARLFRQLSDVQRQVAEVLVQPPNAPGAAANPPAAVHPRVSGPPPEVAELRQQMGELQKQVSAKVILLSQREWEIEDLTEQLRSAVAGAEGRGLAQSSPPSSGQQDTLRAQLHLREKENAELKQQLTSVQLELDTLKHGQSPAVQQVATPTSELQIQITQLEEQLVAASTVNVQQQQKITELSELLSSRDTHIVELRRLHQQPQSASPTPPSSEKIDRSLHEAALQMMRVIQREHALETERVGRELGEEKFRHEETRRKLEEMAIMTAQLRKQIEMDDDSRNKHTNDVRAQLDEAKRTIMELRQKLKELTGSESMSAGSEEGPLSRLRNALEVALSQVDAERRALAMEREAHSLTHAALRDERARWAKDRELLAEELATTKKNLAAVVEEVLAIEEMVAVKDRTVAVLEARLLEKDVALKDKARLKEELGAATEQVKQLQSQLQTTQNQITRRNMSNFPSQQFAHGAHWPAQATPTPPPPVFAAPPPPPSPSRQHPPYQPSPPPTQPSPQPHHTAAYPDVNLNQLSDARYPRARAPIEHHTLTKTDTPTPQKLPPSSSSSTYRPTNSAPTPMVNNSQLWNNLTSLRHQLSPDTTPTYHHTPTPTHSTTHSTRTQLHTTHIPTSPPKDFNKPIGSASQELSSLLSNTSKTIAGKTVEMENIRKQLQATEARLRTLQKEKAEMDAQRDSLVGDALGLEALSKSLTKGIGISSTS